MRRTIRARARESRRLLHAYETSRRAWRNLLQTPDVARLRRSQHRHRLRSTADPPSLVVSLTSFPARIRHVWIPIESLLRQVRGPDRIVLVLSDEEFGTRRLPRRLVEQQARGLEIMYVPDDGRGLDKLVPTRLAYPDATIITVDDDAIYEPWTVSRLVDHAQAHPGAVIGHRGREIRLGDHGFAPYLEWPLATRRSPAGRVLLTGVGGILYPPGVLPLDLLADTALAQALCPTADDVWFWAVATTAGVPIHCLGLPSCRPLWRQDHTPRSVTLNRGGGHNDRQLSSVVEHFGIVLGRDDGPTESEPTRSPAS